MAIKILAPIRIALLVVIVFACVSTTPLLAYMYRADVSVSGTGGNSYTTLGLQWPSKNLWMSTNGFMMPDALDTRVQTPAGLNLPHMVADDRTLVATGINANAQTNLRFATGNTPLSAMPIVVGDGGYFTVADDPALELNDNFEVEHSGYLHPDGGWLVSKGGAFGIHYDGTDVTTVIAGAGPVQTVTPSDAFEEGRAGGASWTNIANSIDGSTGTYAQVNLGASSGTSNWAVFTALGSDKLDSDPLVYTAIRYYLFSGQIASKRLYFYGYDKDSGTTTLLASVTSGLTNNTWLETAFPANSYYSAIFVYAMNTYGSTDYLRLNEVELKYKPDLTVSGAASGESTVKAYADGTNLKLDIGGVNVDSVALGGASVPNTASNWVVTPQGYTNYLDIAVSGTSVARYEPTSMIADIDGFTATLPNELSPGTHNGILTWGANPADITVVLGGLTVPSTLDTAIVDDPTTDRLGAAGAVDWNVGPDVSGSLLANPIRPIITVISDNTALTETQVWLWFGIILVAGVTVFVGSRVNGHHGITAVASGTATIAMVFLTIFPLYALVYLVICILGGWVSERSRAL